MLATTSRVMNGEKTRRLIALSLVLALLAALVGCGSDSPSFPTTPPGENERATALPAATSAPESASTALLAATSTPETTATAVPVSTTTREPSPTVNAISLPTQTTITSPQIYNGNVFVLPVTENLVSRSWDLPLADYTARFYDHFNDEFDFLVFVANVPSDRIWEASIDHGAYYIDIRNDVQGIGKSIFADGQTWGNTEALQGLAYINTYDHEWGGDFSNGVLLHELMHRWANFVVPPFEHWGFVDQACILDGYDISTLIDHGDGKFSHEFSGPSQYVLPHRAVSGGPHSCGGGPGFSDRGGREMDIRRIRQCNRG